MERNHHGNFTVIGESNNDKHIEKAAKTGKTEDCVTAAVYDCTEPKPAAEIF
jgi:hypothetical protein